MQQSHCRSSPLDFLWVRVYAAQHAGPEKTELSEQKSGSTSDQREISSEVFSFLCVNTTDATTVPQ
jgi:hypothetical protein